MAKDEAKTSHRAMQIRAPRWAIDANEMRKGSGKGLRASPQHSPEPSL
jgi:hypothetical protein